MSGGGSVKVELLGTCLEDPAPDPPPKPPPNSCEYPQCRKSFIKPSLLQYHIDTVHKKMKLFMCFHPGCEQSFYLNSKMQRHLQTHMEKKFRCPWCDKMFNRKDNLNHHQKTCQIVLICAVCGATFLSSAELNEHSVSHGQMLKCVVEGCEERMSASTLTEHITRCHVSVIKCACCTKVYSSPADLAVHVTAAHERQELILDEPLDIELWLRTEIFAAASGQGPILTEEHGIMVENELNCSQGTTLPDLPPLPPDPPSAPEPLPKLFHCTYENCTYSTPTPRWLTKHALKHKRQNKCDHCDKTFADKWSLTLHSRTHNAEDITFPCVTCGKVFQSKGRLSQHVQTHHKDSLEWICDRVGCEERYSTHRRLLQHHKYHALGTEPMPSRCAKRAKPPDKLDTLSSDTAAGDRISVITKRRRPKKAKTFLITMTTPETYRPYIEPPAGSS